MALYRLLQQQFFAPEGIEILVQAYEEALRGLHLDRADPVTEQVARKIMETAQRGERDADRLREAALAEIGVALPACEAPRLSPADAGTTRRAGRTLLIVENDEAFAYAVSRYFQWRGFTPVVATGSMMAFRELDRHRVDAVIADVWLNHGEPHGVSLGRMIRNRDRHMPIFLVTAYPDTLERERPLPGPYFVKPVPLVALCNAVEISLAH